MDINTAKGFSTDGYITDQDYFSEYPYREMTSDINGCGWIAAFDLRHALTGFSDFDSVRVEMDEMITLRVPGPTPMRIMLRYLDTHAPGYTVSSGRDAAIRAMEASRCGIVRYNEGFEPHFVPYVGYGDGIFRFFNVADGLEDCLYTAGDFVRTRCLLGNVVVITKND